jgi:hypothetical protein
MVLNYIKEQIALGQIEARKICGKLNTADMHTKPLRSSEFLSMAHKILGQPPPQSPTSPAISFFTLPTETVSYLYHGHGCEEPTKQRDEAIIVDRFRTKRRKAHILRYITRPASDSTMDADVHVPAV